MLSANYGTQIAYKISCRRHKRRKHVNSKSIGKTLVAYSYPSTIDG